MTDGATAATMLDEVERVQGETREKLDPGWLPYLLFGVLTMLSAVFTQIGDGGREGVYWLVAGPIGLIVTWRYYRKHELEIGLLDRQEYVLAGIVAAMFVGAIVIGWVGPDEFSEAGWIFPIGAGLLAVGVYAESPLDGWVGIALLVLGGLLVALEPSEPAVWAAVLTGAVLLAAAAAVRARWR